MNFIESIGFAAAVFTTIAFLPQVIKAWKTRSTHDLSYQMILIFMTGVTLWLIYGILIQDRPVMYANAFTLMLIFILLLLKIRYK